MSGVSVEKPETWPGTPAEWEALVLATTSAFIEAQMDYARLSDGITYAKSWTCGCESAIVKGVKHITKFCPTHGLMTDPEAQKRLLWYRRSRDLYMELTRDSSPVEAETEGVPCACLGEPVDWHDAGLCRRGGQLVATRLTRPVDLNNLDGNSKPT